MIPIAVYPPGFGGKNGEQRPGIDKMPIVRMVLDRDQVRTIVICHLCTLKRLRLALRIDICPRITPGLSPNASCYILTCSGLGDCSVVNSLSMNVALDNLSFESVQGRKDY